MYKIDLKLGRLSRVLFWVIFISIPVIIVCSGYYRYGIGDETITIPFVKHIVNPNLYPGDILIDQQKYYYTYFWYLAAFLYKLGIKLEYVFLGLYLLQVYLFLFSLYLISKDLEIERSLIPIIFFVSLFPEHLPAGMSITGVTVTTRFMALSLILFSLRLFWRDRIYLAFLFAGISYLIHPISGIFCVLTLIAWSLWKALDDNIVKYIYGLLIFLFVVSPLVYWQLMGLYRKGSGLQVASAEWVNLLKLRSSQHLFISLQDRWVLLNAFFSLVILLTGVNFEIDRIRKVYIFIMILIAIVMAAIGTFFVEIIPITGVIYIQPWRYFMLISVIASVYVGVILKNLFKFDKYSGFLLGMFVLIVALFRCFNGANLHNLLKFFISVLSLWGLYFVLVKLCKSASVYITLLSISFILLICLFCIRGDEIGIKNASAREWIDVQLWAKNNTPCNSVFIVPPNTEGFRVESERTIYVDWKSGTLLNFDENYGRNWFSRMRKLGFKSPDSIQKDFTLLPDTVFVDIATHIPAEVYLVDYKKEPSRNFPIVYQNDSFVVYKVKGSEFH